MGDESSNERCCADPCLDSKESFGGKRSLRLSIVPVDLGKTKSEQVVGRVGGEGDKDGEV